MADRPAPGRAAPHSLLLLRHAKSAWPVGVADLDRPLAPRGERAAALVGRFLADHGLVPDRVVSSPARRAAETAARVVAALETAAGHPVGRDVDLDRRLYDGDVLAAVLEHLVGAPRLLAVGHEPDLVDVARALSGAEVRLPTAGLVWLDVHDVDDLPAPSGDGAGGPGGTPVATVRLVLPPKLLDARTA